MAVSTLNIKQRLSIYEFAWNVPSTPWLPNQSINPTEAHDISKQK